MEIKHMDKFTFKGHQIAKYICDQINEKGGKARIDFSWLDFGQRWAWETILVYSKSLDLEYQGLTPRDFKDINEGNFTQERIEKIIADATGGNL